ncbi:bestrophin-like domain [Streptomyces filamentosus]
MRGEPPSGGSSCWVERRAARWARRPSPRTPAASYAGRLSHQPPHPPVQRIARPRSRVGPGQNGPPGLCAGGPDRAPGGWRARGPSYGGASERFGCFLGGGGRKGSRSPGARPGPSRLPWRRSDEREERLTQATAGIPSAIFWFLPATPTITVMALATCLPRKNNRGQLITLAVITALLTTTLCIIRDLDRPFGGIVSVQPTAIDEAERQAERDFAVNRPAEDVPCDEAGNRKRAV